MLDMYFKNTGEAIEFHHTRSEKPQHADFHLHNRFEIYFFIEGDVRYFIEKGVYSLNYGDLLVMNSSEIHKPSFTSNTVYERITIHFDPSVARSLSSPGFDLLQCFKGRPRGENNKIPLSINQIRDLLEIFRKIEKVSSHISEGSDILKLLYFSELLVYINRVFSNTGAVDEMYNIPPKLSQIFNYINNNLDRDLTLETFEKEFFIDRYYLSRLFKKHTGVNLHRYILFKRVSTAKMMLAEGRSVTDVCQACGFNDYSNFIRSFRKIVGTTPGRYGIANR